MKLKVKAVELVEGEPTDYLRQLAQFLKERGFSIIWISKHEFEAISPPYDPVKGYGKT